MFYRDTIGLAPDHGRPPEVEEDYNLESLRQIAADVAAALDQAGALEIYEVHELILPLLDQAEEKLHVLIQARAHTRPHWQIGHQNIVEYLNNEPFQGTLV